MAVIDRFEKRLCSAARRSASGPRSHRPRRSACPDRLRRLPLARTPPHGPLRICLAQLVGHAMPVEDRAHWPHILQSKSSCFAARSSGQQHRSARCVPSHRNGRLETRGKPRAGVIEPLEGGCVPHAPVPQRLHYVLSPRPLVDMSTSLWHLGDAFELILVKLAVAFEIFCRRCARGRHFIGTAID